MNRRCFLRCLMDLHIPIELPHNIETFVGRSKITKIKDQSCSRNQLSLKPNCETCVVNVKQVGVNSSGLHGCAMRRDVDYQVEHGTRVEILLHNHFYVIEFDPPPDSVVPLKHCGKRKLDDNTSYRESKNMKTDNDNDVSLHIKGATESKWDEIDGGELYIFTSKGVKSSHKIASFDMDGTIICTKSGKVHPIDINDWQIAFPSVSKKLREHVDEGYKIVIFSNQAPIGSGKVKIKDFKVKIESLVDKLKVPIQVYIATGKNIYRKPCTGMWKFLSEQKNDGFVIDMDTSFYCGDAVGRLANWAPGKKKDHSMADKLFAENLGVKFYTPEQFFLGHSISNIPMGKPEFYPSEVSSAPFNENLISKEQEILVLVGFPGSGKSFLSNQIEKKSNFKYVSVCRDILGSWQKCAAEATKLLKKGKSVIIDSTNPDIESRGRWTALAKDMGVSCRCCKMAVTKAHAQHNNKFRQLMKINHVPVNDIVFHTFKNKYIDPTVREGFKEVIEAKFNPCFDSEDTKKLYKMYLLEK